MRINPLIPTLAVMPLLLQLSACSEQTADTSASEASAQAAWVLDSEPADASPVSVVKSTAAEGDTVVLRGRIGGRMEPMSAGSPVFTVVDLAVPHCGQIPGDNCPTPWDYCCEPAESMAANTATIQIVSADGRPLNTSPADEGFEPLDEVIVVGLVAPRPDDRVLTISATGVYRVQ